MSDGKTERSPLDDLGLMPALPRGWDSMPVQQDVTKPLQPGHRWPLTFYRRVEVTDINVRLGWGRP